MLASIGNKDSVFCILISSDVVLIVILHGLSLGFVFLGFFTCMCVYVVYDHVFTCLSVAGRRKGGA